MRAHELVDHQQQAALALAVEVVEEVQELTQVGTSSQERMVFARNSYAARCSSRSCRVSLMTSSTSPSVKASRSAWSAAFRTSAAVRHRLATILVITHSLFRLLITASRFVSASIISFDRATFRRVSSNTAEARMPEPSFRPSRKYSSA